MEVIDNYRNIGIKNKSAVTVGVFDGLHKGHQRICDKTMQISNKFKLEPAVITFEPVAQESSLLTTNDEKLELFEKAGFKRVVILKKNGTWKNWTPQEFVEKFLIKKLNTCCLVVGEDFRFGKNRKGNINLLKKYINNFNLVTVSLKKDNGSKISSSDIRQLIKAGSIESVRRHLGRNYFFTGDIVSGKGLGKKIGFPTINFKVVREKLLPQGVFQAQAIFKGSTRKAEGACFIGHAGSGELGHSRFKIELYLFNYKQGMENSICGAELIRKIRDPEKFSSLEELTKRIRQDINEIRKKKKT